MSQALQQKKSKKEYKAKSDGTDHSSVFVSQNEKTQKEITEKTENLIEHLDEIDEQISAHTNAWNLERLGKAELSILRLATYEILLDEQVPRKVAINEAVELAKKYCNEKAAPFINGVLSKIGQDMDEE